MPSPMNIEMEPTHDGVLREPLLPSAHTTVTSNPSNTAGVSERNAVQVVAPATLAAGAMFEATVDGFDFMATVPEGGVVQGETFEVPYPSESAIEQTQIEHARWKADPGFCIHFLSRCCALLLYTQVMERLNLTLCGCLPRVGKQRSCIVNKLGIFFTYVLFIVAVYAGLIASIIWQVEDARVRVRAMFIDLPIYAMFISLPFLFVAKVCTRNSFRKTYNLPPVCCSTGGNDLLDDCCVTFWCSSSSVLQMAYHSQDPKIHSYECVSRTGLRRKESQRVEIV